MEPATGVCAGCAICHSANVSLAGQGHMGQNVICTKAYGQSGPSSANNRSLWATSFQSVEDGLMGMSPHSSQAEDSFTPSIGAWCYQHEGHMQLELLCCSPGPCLGEGDQVCLHDCSHLELHYCWTEVKQIPLGFCACFPQTDVYRWE